MRRSDWRLSRSETFNPQHAGRVSTLQDWIEANKAGLSLSSESPLLDAQVLLAAVLGRSRSWVLAHPDDPLSPQQVEELSSYLERLEQDEPLPFVLGEWEFYGLKFTLNPSVLIPRPESELLVETALKWLSANPGLRLAADVGSGSGCIAVALATHCPDLYLLTSDLSLDALRVARLNVERHHLEGRVELIQADLLPMIGRRFDLICANLPYIPTGKLEQLKVAQWEPRVALDGGRDGLSVIRRLLEMAPDWLAPGGLILLEIEAEQGRAASALAEKSFPRAEIRLLPDLAGKDRLVVIQSRV